MHRQDNNLQTEHTLKQAGLQKTTQRLAVLDVLNRAEVPLTAGDVFQRLPEAQKVNRVTVYRILSSYTQSGIIREFASKKGIHYYERVEPGTHLHPHFICRRCGVLICMSAVSELWWKMTDTPDFEIESICISGLCHLCKIKENKGKKDDKKN